MQESTETTLSREEIVQMVREWGCASSDAVLDPQTNIFTCSEVDGFIGYRQVNGCAIAYGDPVCPKAHIPGLVKAFHTFCKNNNLSVIYLVVSEKFSSWALENGCAVQIEYGEELFMDPNQDPRKREGVHAQLVRRKFRHAEKEGIQIVEYKELDSAIERSIENVGKQWLEARTGPQVHISNIFLFNDREGKRWFYAKKNDQIVGTIVLNKLASKNGWLMNHLMIKKDAPSGTPEMLVLVALETIKNEGSQFVTFGGVPAQNLVEIKGLNSFEKACAKMVYYVFKKMFKLETKKAFWEKFHPSSSKSFLLFQEKSIGIKELRGLTKALNMSV
jgi:lysylphosphatidylglycerol synthetase-like protein (DUF2156 family)